MLLLPLLAVSVTRQEHLLLWMAVITQQQYQEL